MTLSEDDIEDILYNSPWLLNSNYEIANIEGNKGHGRQVAISSDSFTSTSKRIDLLFTDTLDNRPIIIELKKDELERSHIGQILEYRAIIISLDQEIKNKWVEIYGKKYLAPKLILIGKTVSSDVLISASLAGIEVRTFAPIAKQIEITSKSDLILSLQEWKLEVDKGQIPLNERANWVDSIRKTIQSVFNSSYNKEFQTISKLCTTNKHNSYLADAKYPFIDLPVKRDDTEIYGLYEFHDSIPFDHKNFYCEPKFLHEIIDKLSESKGRIMNQKFKEEMEHLNSSFEISMYDYIENNKIYPIMKIPKTIFPPNDNLTEFLEIILNLEENFLDRDDLPKIPTSISIKKDMTYFWFTFMSKFEKTTIAKEKLVSFVKKSTKRHKKFLFIPNLPEYRYRIKIQLKTEEIILSLHSYKKISDESNRKLDEVKNNQIFKQKISDILNQNLGILIFKSRSDGVILLKSLPFPEITEPNQIDSIVSWLSIIISEIHPIIEEYLY